MKFRTMKKKLSIAKLCCSAYCFTAQCTVLPSLFPCIEQIVNKDVLCRLTYRTTDSILQLLFFVDYAHGRGSSAATKFHNAEHGGRRELLRWP